MPDDPRVQRLIEEMLDSGSSPEEVCRDTPELLPEVRDGWRRFRALEARIDELFPEPGSVEDRGPDAARRADCRRSPAMTSIGVLGRGGVGVVYKAVHLRLNRTVALKMLLAGAFATRAERQRFAREAELVAGLRHPNVVQVYDVGDLDGRPYFTMEFVEGGSLAERIAGHAAAGPARPPSCWRRWPTPSPRRTGGGIVHRDLKPSNVLLTADGTPKIARLRPGPGPGGRVVADPDRGRGRDAELHGPRAGPGPDAARSGRRRTCTRSGRCSTNC